MSSGSFVYLLHNFKGILSILTFHRTVEIRNIVVVLLPYFRTLVGEKYHSVGSGLYIPFYGSSVLSFVPPTMSLDIGRIRSRSVYEDSWYWVKVISRK